MEEEIIAFLGGGLIRGVRYETAKKIVSRFGAETMNVIEKTPERLAEVRGISPGKAEKIAESYGKVRVMQGVVMWLSRFGMRLGLCMKIYNYYGDTAVTVISKNPYGLIETIDGVGFLTADRMAKELKVAYDGPFRVRAGVVYCLKESADTEGHTYLSLPKLIQSVCRLLRINVMNLMPAFNGVINELCIDRLTVSVDMDGVAGIQLTKFFNAEKTIAEKLCSLTGKNAPRADIDEVISHYEELHRIKFHETQILAIKTATQSGVCIITGGPGTGKTTIINAILYINNANKMRTALLAPTGRAAKRMEEATGVKASTIHRCLLSNENFLSEDMVIIDEVSMCDCMLTANLLRKIRSGTKIVFVGDADQLPSVGAGNVLGDMIRSGVLPVIRLIQIYRTGDLSTIATNAYRINRGEMPILDNKSTDFFWENARTPEEIRDKVLSLYTRRLPSYLGEKCQIQVLCPLKLGAVGVNNLNKVLQQAVNPPRTDAAQYVYGETTFRTGDRVMHTANNYRQEWTKDGENGKGIFNGDMGRILSVNPYSGEMKVGLEDGRLSTYLRSDLNALTLSYAVTVHKSQGCEFDAVIIPVVSGGYMILTRNLLYTAVTRAKKLVVLVGSEENVRKMAENSYTQKRDSCLCKFLQGFS
jgi:exodeoxyribonuclease V alpha subunit